MTDEVRPPALADGVVAEHQHIAHVAINSKKKLCGRHHVDGLGFGPAGRAGCLADANHDLPE